MGLDETEQKVLEKVTDNALKTIQIKNQNEIMSSLLAKIATIIRDEDLSPMTMIERIALLLEWYDGYQAGIFKANPFGTRLSEVPGDSD